MLRDSGDTGSERFGGGCVGGEWEGRAGGLVAIFLRDRANRRAFEERGARRRLRRVRRQGAQSI